MEMLRKLLNTINLKWAQKARIHAVMGIQRGTGKHPFITVKDGTVYFHAYQHIDSFDTSEGNVLYFQKVELEGMTISEAATTFRSMGYTVSTTDAQRLGMLEETALVLMDTKAKTLDGSGSALFAFENNWYRVLYPVHRVLSKFDGDVDIAIEQMLLPSARGAWLDYWAGFFRIRRLAEESDEMLLRRIFMTLTSAKSNNIAMEELISYYIGTKTQVLDNAPARIEVRVAPQFMESALKVREIIALLKSGGVDYFINYQQGFEENYPAYFRDTTGKTFGTVNESYSSVTVTLPVYAEDYLYVPIELRKGFRLNTSKLNSDSKLARSDKRIVESLGMTLRDSTGTIIKQM